MIVLLLLCLSSEYPYDDQVSVLEFADEDDLDVDVEVGGGDMNQLKLMPVIFCFFFMGLSAFIIPESIVIQVRARCVFPFVCACCVFSRSLY